MLRILSIKRVRDVKHGNRLKCQLVEVFCEILFLLFPAFIVPGVNDLADIRGNTGDNPGTSISLM